MSFPTGDVYLVGCTNVGKSSIFNALLGSDYCKVQASDLVQKATISNWPGTTLNLLKVTVSFSATHCPASYDGANFSHNKFPNYFSFQS
jgi:ribosome biogenesis GTPase A